MNRPDFIGVGTGKSGTTWLWEMLRQHPRVFLPDEKELHYFDDEWYGPPGIRNERAARPLSWYLDYFAPARADQVCGEITPSYLWNATAPRRLHEFDPTLDLIAVLRDPTARVFSSFHFSVVKGEVDAMPFAEALDTYPYLVERTMYGEFLTRYLDYFPEPQLKVAFHDDLVADPRAFLLDIEAFIGVEPFVPDNVDDRQNVTGAHAYPRLNRVLMRARMGLKRHNLESVKERADHWGLTKPFKWVQSQVRPFDDRPTMDPDTEQRLRERFTPDIERVEAITGRDLSAWKQPATSSIA